MPNKKVDQITNRWKSQQAYIDSRYEDWFNNIAFYLGFQYQVWDSDIYSFFVPPLEDENQTIMFADNLIQSLVEGRISKLIGNRPTLKVVSQDKSSESIEQAERETDILKGVWYDRNISTFLIRVALWTVVCNRCFIRPYWDRKNNRAELDLVDGFMVLHDETQRTWQHVRSRGWFDIKSIQSKDRLIKTFPEVKNKIKDLKEVSKAGVCSAQEKIMQLEDRASKAAREEQYREEKSKYAGVETIEHYEAPSDEEKDGMYMVVAGEEEIYRNKLPKGSNGLIPAVEFTDQLGMLTLWGRSLVSRSRQAQKIYNHWYSKIIELGNLSTFYLFPRGSNITEEDLMERAFHIVEYDFEAGKPQILQPEGPTQTWVLILNLIRNSIEHMWGSHEVTSRATTPGGKDMSGRGIALLQKEDTRRLDSPIIRWTDSLQDIGDILLALYRENSTLKQSMVYPTAGGQTMPITFTKSDISGKNKVYIEVDSAYSRNKESTYKLIIETLGLLKNLPRIAGILNNPKKFHEFLSFADEKVANVFIYKNSAVQQQDDENRIMLDLEKDIPKVEPWHIHPDHLDALREFMCSREYRALPYERQREIKFLHMVPHLHYAKLKLPDEVKFTMPEEPTATIPGRGVFKQAPTEPVSEETTIDRSAEAEAAAFEGEVGTEGEV